MFHNVNEAQVWLIGAGPMAVEYAKVLVKENITFEVFGRGKKSANIFFNKTGIDVKTGVLSENISKANYIPEQAIVAVGVEKLKDVTLTLLNHGIKKILVEKPAGLNVVEIEELNNKVDELDRQLFVAYNRRFYASFLKTCEIINADGGIESFIFDFTERSNIIEGLEKASGVKEAWFLGNSTHVIDMAFFVGGKPIDFHALTSGSLSWHPQASVFCGAGQTEKGALFSYHANWGAPGRWSIEFCTKNYKLIHCPLEELVVQKINSFEKVQVELDNRYDIEFKPGLYKEVSAFLYGINGERLLSIKQHLEMVKDVYSKMNGSA